MREKPFHLAITSNKGTELAPATRPIGYGSDQAIVSRWRAACGWALLKGEATTNERSRRRSKEDLPVPGEPHQRIHPLGEEFLGVTVHTWCLPSKVPDEDVVRVDDNAGRIPSLARLTVALHRGQHRERRV